MKIKLIAYGIAQDILEQRQQAFEFKGSSIADLKTNLLLKFPAFADLKNLSFAVEEEYQNDLFELTDDVEVVIIPPVSGG